MEYPYRILEITKEKVIKDFNKLIKYEPTIIRKYNKKITKYNNKIIIFKEDYNLNIEVIDLQTIRPLDKKTILESVKKTNRVVTCEEGFPFSGIGAEISAVINENAFDWLDAPVTRISGKDVPMPYAANLEKLALPQVNDIVNACSNVCNKS